jgi:nucleoside-diphosphate-sugar epimerase
VTGGTGLIGSALCRRLVTQGNAVTVLTRPGSSHRRLAAVADRISIAEADLGDLRQVAALMTRVQPEVVFHLACSIFNPPILTNAEHFDVNVRGMLCLLEALRGTACRFVYTGSAAEYPPGSHRTEDIRPGPVNVYGTMKACASLLLDRYARIYDLQAVRAVLFTVYGPWEAPHRLVPSTILAAMDGRNVCLNNGAVQRDMLFLDDAIEGLCRLATADLAPGTAVNLCSGAGLTVRRVAEDILRLMNSPVAIDERPEQTRPDEIMIVSGDNRRAMALLEWEPAWGLEAGLRECIAWCRTHERMLREWQ